MSENEMNETVVLINPFIVPKGSEDEAIRMWTQARDFLQEQPGYISTKLHRALSPEASYTLINVAEWDSVAAFQAATRAMHENLPRYKVEGVSGNPQLYKIIAT